MIKVSYQCNDDAIIIVGSNSGIGQALTQLCLESKIKIIGIDIQEKPSASHDHLTYFQANPLAKEELEDIARSLKEEQASIVGLVNLSGTIKYFDSIEKASSKNWDETYDISFRSCLHSCQTFAPLLKETSGAAIVNMSSGLAFIGQRNYGPYSAAKAAVVSLTKTLAVELGPNVRVNSVAPGAIDTPFIYGSDGSTRFDLERYRSMIPTGDVAKPIEITHLILYLLSEGASHVNGQCIHINGGVN